MKTLNNLTPSESRDLITTFGLNYNLRVFTNRLHQCTNSRHIDFKDALTHVIERWMSELDVITEKHIKHENETKDTTGEDA